MFHIVGERNEKFKTQIFAKSQKTRIERIRQSAVERNEQPLFFAFVLGIFSCFFHKKASCFGRRLRWRQKSSMHAQPFKEHKRNRHRYIPASVKTSVRKNRRAIKSGRLQVVQGSVEALPFASNLFDLVTAVESVHYWEIEKGLSEVYRTLKKGGQLLIVNETQSSDGLDEYLAEVGFKVYTAKQLENFLKQTGFKKIRTDVNENGKWIAVVAEK